MTATPVAFPIRAINISPGSHVLIEAVSWQQYEALLAELGADRHIPRINYADQTLELMSPLPIHERPHRLMAAIVMTLWELSNFRYQSNISRFSAKRDDPSVDAESKTVGHASDAAAVTAAIRIASAQVVKRFVAARLKFGSSSDRSLNKLELKSFLLY